ncbi:hypothetical protein APX81_18060 [Escherichia coli]|nr:hypothetical protein [Escherichia coli]EFN9261582.1 hypothetical protein [Escherichia coli]PAZ27079.1 hypothetical protein APU33_03170 [Escherichia coli]PAZ31169.1 hypothetical protein APU34_08630 [Escherichia coli]PAZ33207.1 hypothetical protein APU35_25205 [Escherichia coli]
MVINIPAVEGGRQRTDGTAAGGIPGKGKRTALFNGVSEELAEQRESDRILPDIQPADKVKSGIAHISYGVLQASSYRHVFSL